MKVTTVLASFMAAASLNAAVIKQVIVRQQWPWSTDVKVEYKLADVQTPVNISVKAFNGESELDNSRLADSIVGDLYGITESGIGQLAARAVCWPASCWVDCCLPRATILRFPKCMA